MTDEYNKAACSSEVSEIRNNLLSRKAIEKIIDEAPLNEVVFIVAPYGYGKTSAVRAWLREKEEKAFWIDLEEPEDAGSFLASRLPEVKGDHKILVIDNFGYVKDVVLQRSVRDYIYLLLGKVRIILISRIEPPPVFNDLILKGHMRLITSNELNFSIEEIRDFLETNGQHDVPMGDILQIQADIGGWPAALNAILAVSRRGVPVTYNETARSYIRGFFEVEIWEDLDKGLQEFLMKTSVLEELNPSSCYALTGEGSSQVILNSLFLNGLFISKLEERDSFRYHRVFRDFLSDKLRLSGIDESELNSKFAWWLYERNEFERSFHYFFAAENYYGISQIYKVLIPASMGIEKYLKLTDCITALNISDLKPYPTIVAEMALVHYVKGNIEEMQSLLSLFLEWIDPGVLPISPEQYAEYVWEAGWLSYLNPEEASLNNQKHMEWCNYKEYVPHLENQHVARAAVLRFPSILHGLRDYCSVLDSAEDFLKRAEGTGDQPIREESSLWELDLIIAEYAYEIEDFAKAERLVRSVMAQSEKRQYSDIYFVCTALLVKLMRAAHNSKEIGALISRLKAMIIDRGELYLLPNFHAFELLNRLEDGHAGLTEIFEEENKDTRDKPYFYLLYRQTALVRGLLSDGGYSEALVILGSLDILCHKYGRTMDLMEVYILKAVALYGLGYEEDACGRLSEALQMAEKYGFIRLFSDSAKDIWPILEPVSKRMPGKHVKNVVISCKKALTQSGYQFSGKKYSHIELTKTELKILKALKADMNYEEIALDNNIKISTVKSHAHSIYSKLGVNNKTSAVIEGQKKGIID